jgi:hypothetical protein
LSVKTVKVNPGDDGAESQVNLLGRKAPRSSISHEQDTTVHEFDPNETIPYQEDWNYQAKILVRPFNPLIV